MPTEQKKREISDLIDHLKKHKDAVLIIGEKIAPELNIKSISDADGENVFNRKSWVKTPSEFWTYYFENIYKNTDDLKEMPKIYKSINELLSLGLVKKVFSMNTHGLSEEAINLKGTGKGFKCSKCGAKFDLNTIEESLAETMNTLDCGVSKIIHTFTCSNCNATKKIRPTCLMYGEHYFFNEMKLMLSEIFNEQEGEQVLPNTHTVIYLGVDMEEDFMGELFDNYALVRDRIEEECFNVMITDSVNTVELFKPEFATSENIDDSLDRLINLLK